MIIYLRDILCKLKQELADCLFTSFWKQLAEDLSEFLFNEVQLGLDVLRSFEMVKLVSL